MQNASLPPISGLEPGAEARIVVPAAGIVDLRAGAAAGATLTIALEAQRRRGIEQIVDTDIELQIPTHAGIATADVPLEPNVVVEYGRGFRDVRIIRVLRRTALQ